MSELHKQRDPGIKGYDPTKKRPPMTQLQCPYCWFAHHHKGVLQRHINEQHWDKAAPQQSTSPDEGSKASPYEPGEQQ